MGGGGAAVFYTLRFVALFVFICVWLPRDGKLYASLLVVPLFLVFLFSRGNFDTIGVMKDVLFFLLFAWSKSVVRGKLHRWYDYKLCCVSLSFSLFFFSSFCPCFDCCIERLFFFFLLLLLA